MHNQPFDKPGTSIFKESKKKHSEYIKNEKFRTSLISDTDLVRKLK